MKHFPTFLAIATLLCMGFSFQPNTDSNDLPPINFQGTLTGRNGITWNAEYITIGGHYKKIPFYAPVADPEQNPHANKTFINLAQIQAIEVLNNQPTITYKHRIFVPIRITLNGQKEAEEFLIEQKRKIVCHQITSDGISLPQEITFQALTSLMLTSNKSDFPQQSQQTITTKHFTENNQRAQDQPTVPAIKKTVHFTTE